MSGEGWQGRWGIVDGQPYLVGGTNVWNVPWQPTDEGFARPDPIYGERHQFRIWMVSTPAGPRRFAASELSSNVWAILEPPQRHS